MSTHYALIRDSLLEIVERLSKIRAEDSNKRLQELNEKLTQQQFNLVVMGQFKRGKSTFINALLGAEIVPTAIVPLTSIVTILRFGRETKAIVHYLNGHEEEVQLSDIPNFVTERGNPENRLCVQHVEVLYPCDYLKGGVRIIDTPGVGSVFRHNTDIAYAYLPYVDAGVFIVTADPPVGESEHRFLKDMRGYVDKLFFVLNKIDVVDEKDLNEASAFTGDILTRDLEQEVNIWPVSAKLALDGKLKGDSEKLARSRLLTFENDLKHFLHHDKGIAFLQAVISALLRHIADESMAYKLEQEAAKLSLDELKAKIAKFEDHARVAEKERDQKAFILEGQVKKLHEMLDDDLEALKKDKTPTLVRDVEAIFGEKVAKSPGSRELEKEMENFVFGQILNVFSTFRNNESEKIAEALESIYVDLANRTNETIESIVRLASDLFEVKLKPFTTVEKLTGKSDFYFLLRDDPDATALIQLGIRSALPTFVTKGVILKRMRTMAKDVFERHCGRVRYDLIRRTDDTTRKFRKDLNDKIDLTLSAIRDALKRAVALKDQSEQQVSQTLTNLSGRLSVIEKIRVELLDYRRQVQSL
ncbi:MAG: dynamin family protein [Deltaproteobacteria bacterium]|nr:dynamin family protein [Deltaproteobacteria bacterium]